MYIYLSVFLYFSFLRCLSFLSLYFLQSINISHTGSIYLSIYLSITSPFFLSVYCSFYNLYLPLFFQTSFQSFQIENFLYVGAARTIDVILLKDIQISNDGCGKLSCHLIHPYAYINSIPRNNLMSIYFRARKSFHQPWRPIFFSLQRWR